MRSRHAHVVINLDQIRANAEAIRRHTGVRLIAVIKSDAYGLGAPRVADALVGVADEFAYFSLHEAREVGRPGLVLGPPEGDAAEYRELNLRPAVSTIEEARRFAHLPVAVNIDTGMQRFGCPPTALDDVLRAANAVDVFTHAMELPAARQLADLCNGRGPWLHAASTSLLETPASWLDAVRPGLALFLGATRITTPLVTARETHGVVGYSKFEAPHVGVILAGYAHGLQSAPVRINGRPQHLIEVGMNTSFVTVDPRDRVGDDVVLLGDGLAESEVARHLKCRPHEVLCRYGALGHRAYTTSDSLVNEPARR